LGIYCWLRPCDPDIIWSCGCAIDCIPMCEPDIVLG
jgi:hypothetical protein